MYSWSIRTLDSYHKNNSEYNWIHNHIHDSTQILDVICENNQLISSSVIIQGRLRKIDFIIYSLMKQKKNSEEIINFIEAYNISLRLKNI